MVRNQRDETKDTFTITNWTDDPTMDCNTGTLGVVADCLGTLIKVLIEQGVIQGSVSA